MKKEAQTQNNIIDNKAKTNLVLKAVRQNKVGSYKGNDVFRFYILKQDAAKYKFSAIRFGYMKDDGKVAFVNTFTALNGQQVVVNKSSKNNPVQNEM